MQEIVFAADTVPGFGWRSYRIEEGEGPATALRAEGRSLANEHVQVDVDPDNGTLAIAVDGVRVAGANRYVDGGDGGDTYNYSPPTEDRVVDRPTSVQVEVLEPGPVRARLLVRATYEWPACAIGDERSCSARSTDTVTTEVRTTLELRTGERFLRVRVDFDNHARDHRLRAHFPLPAPVDGSDAECAFAVVRRGLTAEGGPHEYGLPTFVSPAIRRRERRQPADSRSCTTASSSTRWSTTGASSRSRSCARRATSPARRWCCARTRRARSTRCAVRSSRSPSHSSTQSCCTVATGRAAALHDVADEVLVPLGRVRGGGWTGAHRPATGSRLTVEGARVSAVTRAAAGDPLTVRVFNPSPDASVVRVACDDDPARGDVVDLLGEVVAPFEGEVALRPWEIVTLRVTA